MVHAAVFPVRWARWRSPVRSGHPYAAAVVLAAVSPVSAWLLRPNALAP